MSKQSFDIKNLENIVSIRKSKSNSISKKKRYGSIQRLSELIESGTYKMDSLYVFHKNGKPVYNTASFEDEISLSKLSFNLKAIYKVRQSDRSTIIKQVISLIREDVPKYIYKFDIADFYESVLPNAYRNKIMKDKLVSIESEYVLNQFSNALLELNCEGLPRGIGLSSTLSEIVMKDFDRKIKSLDGVYYYGRFVDDIIIFSTKRVDIKNVASELPEGMVLNWKKTSFCKVSSCLCEESCIHDTAPCGCLMKCKCTVSGTTKKWSLNYLGYSFLFPVVSGKFYQKYIKIDLAKNKIDKIKKRLHSVFEYYRNKGNFKLLLLRVRFLTGNHYVSNKKHDVNRIKSGVFYNYIHLDEDNSYKDLDCFLRGLIHVNRNLRFSFSADQKTQLMKFSFVSGYDKRIVASFNAVQINKIKGCWNNG